MFIGTGSELNDAKIYLGNLLMFTEEYKSRLLLIGESKNKNIMLTNIVASYLSFNGYDIETFTEKEILNQERKIKKCDYIIVYDIFSKDGYTEDEIRNLKEFLNIYQHNYIFLVFNSSVTKLIEMRKIGVLKNDTLWSRNILGCKQIFMDDNDKIKFRKFVETDNRGDRRIQITLDHLNENIDPYNKINGFSINKVKKEIKFGDDSKNNVLIIDKNNNIRLVTLEESKNISPLVKLESFGRCLGNVGISIGDEEAERYLKKLLQGYLRYLDSGNSQYVDYCYRQSEDIEETIMKIKRADNN